MLREIARLFRFAALLLTLALLVLAAVPAEAAPPGPPTPVGPAGVVEGSTLTFTWRASAGATFYFLHVNDPTASPRFTAWYPAGQACPADSATCSVSVTMSWGTGAGTWWVQAWNPEGLAWSTGTSLTLKYTPPAWSDRILRTADRFQVVLDGSAVLDHETGLVWVRIPATGLALNWADALDYCVGSFTGGRGWRLPTVQELSSLALLPADHPFAPAASGVLFWTSTTRASDATKAFAIRPDPVAFSLLSVLKSDATSSHGWCVRAPGHSP